jgi:exodeoxyribonuclease-3
LIGAHRVATLSSDPVTIHTWSRSRKVRHRALKVVSWNVERATRSVALLPQLAEAVKPDVLCLQELGIRPRDDVALAALQSSLPHYHCYYSLARDPRNATHRGGRMYGVATFARGDWRAEVPDWDLEGRVVVLRRSDLAVVNVYAVNGTSKPYFDASGVVDGDRHAWKRRFQSLVLDLGFQLQRNAAVIMAGDWNVSRAADDTHPRLRTEEPHARARSEFNERLRATRFVDIWRERNPTERAYTWFNRRARELDAARVDFVLISDQLVPRVIDARILPRLPSSDHAPVSIEIRDSN